MSLLMEALEKAEEARRRTEDLARERAAPREVFAVRRPEPGKAFGLIVGAGLLALLGVGGYFWWQLRAIGSPGAAHPMASPVAAALSAVAVSPAAAAPLTVAAPPAVAAPPVASAALPVSLPPAETSAPAIRAVASPRPPADRPAPAADSPRRAPADAALELRATRTVPRANPALERAYEALQAGRDGEALRAYEQALHADGKNADILLGLATLAARRRETDAAHAYYLRALEADPNDATARAGVFSTGGRGDEAVAESQLKTALARQPDSPPLNFALGSLYARQQRWSEAQQAYFRAYTGDSANPDLIFNLAVSLDHLRQDRLAAQYYRMALDAGAARTAAFDRNQVTSRLKALQP
jgi:Tfp pilus assembly protein PilF